MNVLLSLLPPQLRKSCFSLLLSDTCLFPDLVAFLLFRDTNVTTGSETPCSALNMAENKSMYWFPLTGLPSKSGWCAQLWAKFPAISPHVPYAMVFGNAGDSSFIPLLIAKRLQAKLQYPTCFVTTALQEHPGNSFSYRNPSILLKDRVASSIESLLPTPPTPFPSQLFLEMVISQWKYKDEVEREGP